MPSTPAKFDYAGARRAGFTDEQIAAHLAAKRAAGVNVVVDRAEVDSVRNGGVDPPIMTAENNPATQFMKSLRGRVTEALPAAGGLVGGLVGAGTPARIPLAAVGGALGEAGREALTGGPMSAEDITKSGLEQGAYETAGGLITKGATRAASGLMRGALGVGKPIAGQIKVGKTFFRDPVPDALMEAVGAGEGGALKARALLKGTGREIGSLLKKEAASGRELRTSEVIKYAKEMLKDKSLTGAQRAKVFNELATFYREKGAKMDPELVQQIKRRYGGKYKNWGKGKDPLTDAIEAEMSNKMSVGAGEALDVIPGMGELNQRYGNLKNLKGFVETAATKRAPTWELQKPGTVPLLRGLVSNRAVNSNIAIKLANPAWQRLYRQSPRLFFALIDQANYSDQPDASAQ